MSKCALIGGWIILLLVSCSTPNPTPNEALGQSHCKRDCIDTPKEEK